MGNSTPLRIPFCASYRAPVIARNLPIQPIVLSFTTIGDRRSDNDQGKRSYFRPTPRSSPTAASGACGGDKTATTFRDACTSCTKFPRHDQKLDEGVFAVCSASHTM